MDVHRFPRRAQVEGAMAKKLHRAKKHVLDARYRKVACEMAMQKYHRDAAKILARAVRATGVVWPEMQGLTGRLGTHSAKGPMTLLIAQTHNTTERFRY